MPSSEQMLLDKVGKIAEWIRNSKSTDPVREVSMKAIRLSGAPERDPKSEIAAMFYDVRDNIHYVFDPRGVDVFEGPEWTLRNQAGDCDAHTILLGSMLESANYHTGIRVASYDGTTWSHVYLVVTDKAGMMLTPENALPLDPTIPNAYPGYERPFMAIRTFTV